MDTTSRFPGYLLLGAWLLLIVGIIVALTGQGPAYNAALYGDGQMLRHAHHLYLAGGVLVVLSAATFASAIYARGRA